ncbi:hypothetical protein [Limosilactobacillus fastidiosus]|uniref:hypothetical protein n=1 Tax=Limosilactobacillus fastidiosus TaxID=2759855 RepID=UPI001E334388|nr:hypothetical protein [Limosilactobacillus fastidiosus]
MIKLDQVRVAQLADLQEVVCTHQSLDQFGADWTLGDYPSVEGLRDYILYSTLVIGFKGEKVVAAGVLTTGVKYPDVD